MSVKLTSVILLRTILFSVSNSIKCPTIDAFIDNLLQEHAALTVDLSHALINFSLSPRQRVWGVPLGLKGKGMVRFM